MYKPDLVNIYETYEWSMDCIVYDNKLFYYM